jgi:hypothetical protein
MEEQNDLCCVNLLIHPSSFPVLTAVDHLACGQLRLIRTFVVTQKYRVSACSLGLSATSQHYFSLRTNQPPATSQ